MKKIYLMFFGTMFATCAMAQQGKGGLVLDSMTTSYGNVKAMLSINEYNSSKTLTSSYSYACMDDKGKSINPPQLQGRTDFTYNGDVITELRGYNYDNGEYIPSVITTLSNFQGKQAMVSITQMVNPMNPEAGMQNSSKTEVTELVGGLPKTEKDYNWKDGEWQLSGTVTYEYNAKNLVVKETSNSTSDMGGMTTKNVTETTYEYDANDYPVKETTVTSTIMDIPGYGEMNMGTNESVITYSNEYYADGNIKTIAKTQDEETSTEKYYWGDGKAKGGAITAIDMVRQQMQQMQRIYDLQGRSVKNATKGLYIVNGKKVVLK